MSDINCPYCEKEIEICHDDGVGYEEGVTHNQQCKYCDKYFTFTTSISYHYEAEKADCLNGSPHKWEKVRHYPKHFPEWVRCVVCDEEVGGEFYTSEKA